MGFFLMLLVLHVGVETLGAGKVLNSNIRKRGLNDVSQKSPGSTNTLNEAFFDRLKYENLSFFNLRGYVLCRCMKTRGQCTKTKISH